MRRLYLRIYLAVLASLVAFALVAGFLWRVLGEGGPSGYAFEVAGVLAQNVLPPAEAPAAEQQAALERLAANLRADVALFAADRRPLAHVGQAVPAPDPGRERGGWMRAWGRPTGVVHLRDGRWLVARVRPEHRPSGLPFFLTLGLLALAVGIGAYPVVRRLTARLERLQAGGSTAGGAGIQLAYQVAMEFRDPTYFWRGVMRASCLGLLGRGAEAEAEIAGLLKEKPDFGARGRTLIGHYVKLPDVFDRVLAVNVKGVWLGIKTVAPLLRARGGGVIVNTASIAGLRGSRNLVAYTASKHAVVGLTRSAALELAPDRIRVNVVCPSPIETDMVRLLEEGASPANPAAFHDRMAGVIPMKRYGTPDEVAALVLFLCSADAVYITGAIYPVDGGSMA